MHARTRAAALVSALALATTLGLSACGGEPTGNSSSFGNVSGSAVAVADELTALCAQVVEQALDLETATALAEGSGYQSRVIKLDGEDQPATADLRDDRMNFEVENDVVTACTVG